MRALWRGKHDRRRARDAGHYDLAAVALGVMSLVLLLWAFGVIPKK